MLGVLNEGDQLSSTILDIIIIYGQNQLFIFLKSAIIYCTILGKGLFQILANFCEDSERGSEGFCTVNGIYKINYIFGITQANVCIK